jgi:hypothetical protein
MLLGNSLEKTWSTQGGNAAGEVIDLPGVPGCDPITADFAAKA